MRYLIVLALVVQALAGPDHKPAEKDKKPIDPPTNTDAHSVDQQDRTRPPSDVNSSGPLSPGGKDHSPSHLHDEQGKDHSPPDGHRNDERQAGRPKKEKKEKISVHPPTNAEVHPVDQQAETAQPKDDNSSGPPSPGGRDHNPGHPHRSSPPDGHRNDERQARRPNKGRHQGGPSGPKKSSHLPANGHQSKHPKKGNGSSKESSEEKEETPKSNNTQSTNNTGSSSNDTSGANSTVTGQTPTANNTPSTNVSETGSSPNDTSVDNSTVTEPTPTANNTPSTNVSETGSSPNDTSVDNSTVTGLSDGTVPPSDQQSGDVTKDNTVQDPTPAPNGEGNSQVDPPNQTT